MSHALFIVDSYNWALANRANNLKANYSKHNILIKRFDDLLDINFNNFDLVYVLNWKDHKNIYKKISPERKYRLVTTISSHVGRGNAESISNILKNYDAISTSSNFLFDEFKKVYKDKVYNTPFGVDTVLFIKRNDPAQFSNIFGWVGNEKRPVKRFENVKKIFQKLGSRYKLKTAFQSDALSHNQMVNFYNSIGTLICFSESEGTPNPVLEAGACGRNILSTEVGNVPEINIGSFLKIVHNEKDLKELILYYSNNPNIISKNGILINKIISDDWSWEKKSESFEPFLELKRR